VDPDPSTTGSGRVKTAGSDSSVSLQKSASGRFQAIDPARPRTQKVLPPKPSEPKPPESKPESKPAETKPPGSVSDAKALLSKSATDDSVFHMEAPTTLAKPDEHAPTELGGPDDSIFHTEVQGGTKAEPHPTPTHVATDTDSLFADDVTNLSGAKKSPELTALPPVRPVTQRLSARSSARLPAQKPPTADAEPGRPEKPTSARLNKTSGSVAIQAELDALAAEGGIEIKSGLVIGGVEVEAAVGRGRSTFVYRGKKKDGEAAVVKILDQRLSGRQGYSEQFMEAMRTLARVQHPNVARVFASGVDQAGRHFLAMEYLDGGSVETYWKEKDSKLSWPEAVKIVREVGRGLADIHRAGLIHRDVRPKNILRSAAGLVKIADAAIVPPSESDVYLTTDAQVTPEYMSPEQADGRRADVKADQYSLGVTLFQLVCGRLPFEAKKPLDLVIAHAREKPPNPGTLTEVMPEWLEAAILKMLAKAPEDRFESMDDVVKVLEAEDQATRRVATLSEAKTVTAVITPEEIFALEKGIPSRPVLMPGWLGVLGLVGGLAAAAVIFINEPLRLLIDARPPKHEGLPFVVTRVLKEADLRLKAATAADLVAAQTLLEQRIADMGTAEGVTELRARAAVVKKKIDELRADRQARLDKFVEQSLNGGQFGQAIDKADPKDPEIVLLGLGDAASALREKTIFRLAHDRGQAYVPGGTFLSGPTASSVTVAAFYIDRTEVTNAAWAAAVAKKVVPAPASWKNGKPLKGTEELPVTGISIAEARAYALSQGKRLPRRVEWEKAARGAGDARSYPWGDAFASGKANLLEGGSGSLEPVTGRTEDVSPWGVLGLAGNAMEWADSDDGPLWCGGGFHSHRLSARVWSAMTPTAERHPAVGFRCVADAETAPR
jgi:formylglycine-generating enzyme required for sulfatase activity/tRNA A-37 threonylcarbamoyl transferase component Bud32